LTELGLLSWVVSSTVSSPITRITITTIITTITTVVQKEKKPSASEKRRKVYNRRFMI